MKALFLVAVVTALICSCSKPSETVEVFSLGDCQEQGVLNWNWATLDYQLFTENFDLVCSGAPFGFSCVDIVKIPNRRKVRFTFSGTIPCDEVFYTYQYDLQDIDCVDEPMYSWNFVYPSENVVVVYLNFGADEWECLDELHETKALA